MKTATPAIDVMEVGVDEDMPVLEVALQNDIYIPQLCYHPDLKPVGACRLCGELPTLCTTPAGDGMYDGKDEYTTLRWYRLPRGYEVSHHYQRRRTGVWFP